MHCFQQIICHSRRKNIFLSPNSLRCLAFSSSSSSPFVPSRDKIPINGIHRGTIESLIDCRPHQRHLSTSGLIDRDMVDGLSRYPPPLLELKNVHLQYPKKSSSSNTKSNTGPEVNLSIYAPTSGGHALLGRNGSGKSLLGQALVASTIRNGNENVTNEYVTAGQFHLPKVWMSNAVAHVSFDSHQALLEWEAEYGDTDDGLEEDDGHGGLSCYRAISGGGTLNKAAQFLIVRFGLFGLLKRNVNTLSTGEIRKTLLVRALSQRPKLLVLDNAFDGLDVESREILQDIVKKTITGFTQDILVQGVSSKATAHTQIIMMTHRPEELVDEIEHVSYFHSDDDYSKLTNSEGELVTEERQSRSGSTLLQKAFNMKDLFTKIDWKGSNALNIPSVEDAASWWNRYRDHHSNAINDCTSLPLVEAKKLSIKRGDAVLLNDLNWTVEKGQRWLIGGGNGAGKSTLSRLLVRPSDAQDLDEDSISVRGRIGWVSTERHMEIAKSEDTALQILTCNGKRDKESAIEVSNWLGLTTTNDLDASNRFLDTSFCHLSQGQQKMVLIGAALAAKPDLLVLDEPCQGLDGVNRQKVLILIERLCQATDISLVYITHHLEECMPSITNVLHLKEQRDVYQGSMEMYDPKNL